jgi:hypothetical protein
MRNQEIKKINQPMGTVIQLVPIKTPAHEINDAEIRHLVARSCQDLLDDYSGDEYMDAFHVLNLQKSIRKTDTPSSFPICEPHRTDLSMYWDLMVQKQLLTFDHESHLVMQLNQQLFA